MKYNSWVRGKCTAWDATTSDTVPASHLVATRNCSGAAALHAAAQKDWKYSALTSTHASTYIFIPAAVETLGPWNPDVLDFVRELDHRITLVADNPTETASLLQRISVAV